MHPEQWKVLHAGELAFFAKISASVSHEIKNHLAIINEQNGLLGDLLAIASKGSGLQTIRLNAVVGDIAKQITLTDTIVRRFNTFAHTADKPTASVDVGDSLILLAQIGGRLARLKEIRLIVDEHPEHVCIQTNQFAFLHLLYICLDMLLCGGARGDAVIIGLESLEKNVKIIMQAQGGLDQDHFSHDDGVLPLLTDMLRAQFAVDIVASRLVLTLPCTTCRI